MKPTPDVRVGDVYVDDIFDHRVTEINGDYVQGTCGEASTFSFVRESLTDMRLVERGGVRIGDVWRLGDQPTSDMHIHGLRGDNVKGQQEGYAPVTIPIAWVLNGRLIERDGKPVEA